MMADKKRSNHFFEAESVSGVLMFMIDNDKSVFIQFSRRIKLEVLFDSSSESGNALKDSYMKSIDSLEVSGSDKLNEAVGYDRNGKASVVNAEEECKIDVFDKNEVSDGTPECSPKTRRSKRINSSKNSDNANETDNINSSLYKKYKLREKVKKKLKLKLRKRGAAKNIALTPAEQKNAKKRTKKRNDKESPMENSETKLSRLDEAKTDFQENMLTLKKPDNDFEENDNKNPVVKEVILKRRPGRPRKVLEKVSDGAELKDKPRKLLQKKTVKCEYCDVEFENTQSYYDHRRAQESIHECKICGKVEPFEAHLIVHMHRHMRKRKDSTSGATSESSEIMQRPGKKGKREKMKCNVCGLVVSSVDSLKIHTMFHTGECAYQCCVCQEKFSCLSSRQHHMKTHVSQLRYKCQRCGERFESRGDLTRHQQTHEIKCSICGETFPNKTSRTCHFRVAHPNEILKCEVCSSLFSSDEDLQKHLAYHKKFKKEQCPTCGLVVSKLKDHMLIHTEGGPEKLYQCSLCPMLYLRKSNLDRHLRTHTGEKPYACNKCPKRFRSNGMLRKHLLIHTQERPFQCDICGKRCAIRSNLNIHMRVHNTIRPYPCSLCPKRFNHKNSLSSHLKTKHWNEVRVHQKQVEVYGVKEELGPREPHVVAGEPLGGDTQNAEIFPPQRIEQNIPSQRIEQNIPSQSTNEQNTCTNEQNTHLQLALALGKDEQDMHAVSHLGKEDHDMQTDMSVETGNYHRQINMPLIHEDPNIHIATPLSTDKQNIPKAMPLSAENQNIQISMPRISREQIIETAMALNRVEENMQIVQPLNRELSMQMAPPVVRDEDIVSNRAIASNREEHNVAIPFSREEQRMQMIIPMSREENNAQSPVTLSKEQIQELHPVAMSMGHPVSQSSHAPIFVPRIERPVHMASGNRHYNLQMALGMGSNPSPGAMSVKPGELQEYSQTQLPVSFSTSVPMSIPENLVVEPGGSRYEMDPQAIDSDNHQF